MTQDRLTAAVAARYAILRAVGAGGMATVYLAEDRRHRRQVALKVLHPELAQAIGPDRFLREIETTAALHHPHILPLYDSGEADGFLYYVMPYVEGESLRDRLTRERQLSLSEALQITREVADALGYAHAHGVIHRDIKPENILLEGGHAVVADFGIAKAVTTAGTAPLTQTGMAMGTPYYMSPEQASGERSIDGRSDLYSLGCVLYEMLAGQPPFTGPSAESIVHQHLAVAPRAVTDLRPAVPAQVSALLTQLLAKTPADRFSTAATFTRTLEQCVALGTGTPPRTASPRLRNLRGWLPWFGVALVAALAFAIALRVHGHGEAGGRPGLLVRPFANLGSPDGDAFAAGMTEEVTSRLARMSGLHVISLASALPYKDTDRPLRDIGSELGVAYVLEGSTDIDQPPDGEGQVRVTLHLVRVSDLSSMWSQTYAASLALGEVFGLQSQIAERVARALDVRVGGSERQAVQRDPTTDREAHDAYLQGRYLWDRRGPSDLERAADYFTRATERDSQYAQAWAGLADTYALWPLFRITRLSRGEAYRLAKEAARRATSLDPNLAEAHASLAYVRMYGDWDWASAENEFRRAIALDPNYPVAHYWYMELLIALGREDEAVAQAQRAVDLAPALAIAQHLLGWSIAQAGHPDSGLRLTRRALELEPGLEFANVPLGFRALLDGRYDAATALFEHVPPYRPFARAFTEARRNPVNRPSAVRAISAVARALGDSIDPGFVALAFGIAGAMDSTVSWYRRAYRERTEGFVYITWLRPWVPEIVDDPRLVALRRSAGLPK
jgi:TolB-like protein/Flp pilus assembly protein TadD